MAGLGKPEGYMAETKYILVLANSARVGKYCVAGKIATPRDDDTFDIQQQWVRLTDPRNAEGAVPYASTICPGHGQIHPLDIIKLDLREFGFHVKLAPRGRRFNSASPTQLQTIPSS
jgi:hypothetical protein